MRFDIITLFPELFTPFLAHGITRRAWGPGGPMQVHLWQLRAFGAGPHQRVDDRPFGGGPGMVLQAEPLQRCLEAIWAARESVPGESVPDAPPPLLLFSPAGQRLEHACAAHWARQPGGAILLCARYEGVDERFVQRHVTHQISLGDFVLSGGEIAALALLDAIARLLPGVLGDAQSAAHDSFHPELDGLLDCPHYTRPEVWQGEQVPEVLLGGNHAQIARWRREQSLASSARQRPDLLDRARRAQRLSCQDEDFIAKL